MLEVKVKGPAIKLQGKWKFKGETALVEEKEYKANEKYLELLGEEKKAGTAKPQAPASNDNTKNDKELEELREKAKDLGIKGAHNMKKETLLAKIEEMEKEESGTDNEDDETDVEGQPKVEGTGEEGQPQE